MNCKSLVVVVFIRAEHLVKNFQVFPSTSHVALKSGRIIN